MRLIVSNGSVFKSKRRSASEAVADVVMLSAGHQGHLEPAEPESRAEGELRARRDRPALKRQAW